MKSYLAKMRAIALQTSAQSEWQPTRREEDTLSRYLGAEIDYNKLEREYEAAMSFQGRDRCKPRAN